ncbi:hypothetical protein [Penaeicola halotolerans]|uniref:hypothetical protein n=1 Tax=Penaeicola halotolerans TaxID=2793196 RepID=UPI001CF8F5CB|nr:hypothetical protein [Penaeicola halotolerans]
MNIRNVLLIAAFIILITIDVELGISIDMFTLIFLIAFILFKLMDYHKISEARAESECIISIKSQQWIGIIAFWVIFSFQIIYRVENTYIMAGCIILVIFLITLNIITDKKDDYQITQTQIIHLQTDKKIDLKTIRRITQSDEKVAIHTDKYENHLTFKFSKLANMNKDQLLHKLSTIEIVK